MSFENTLTQYNYFNNKANELQSQLANEEFSEAHQIWIKKKIIHMCAECIAGRQGFNVLRATDIIPNKLWLKDKTWNFILSEFEKAGAMIIRKPIEDQGNVEFIIFSIYKEWINHVECMPISRQIVGGSE